MLIQMLRLSGAAGGRRWTLPAGSTKGCLLMGGRFY